MTDNRESAMLRCQSDDDERRISGILASSYGIDAPGIEPLTLGADADSTVHRAGDWFVKLRRGEHGAVGAQVARALFAAGIDAVVAPIPTKTRELWAPIEDRRLLVYPFLELTPASARPLRDEQWAALGAAVRRVHDLVLSAALSEQVPQVNYDAPWRAALGEEMRPRAATDALSDALNVELERHRTRIEALIERSEALAIYMRTRRPNHVVCHTDLHGYNVLTDAAGRVRIVDWDAPLRAPRERDLMFIGGAQFGTHSAADEMRLFYAGYGPVDVDAAALEYFRRERIIEDLVLFIRSVRSTADNDRTRAQSLRWMLSNFAPGSTLDAAAG